MVRPDLMGEALFAALVAVVLILLWWLFFSRARWLDRLGAIGLMAVGVAATYRIIHVSIQGGMMGFMFYIYVIPALGLALVAWAAATRRLAPAPRRAWMIVAIVLACGVFTLVRTNGMSGDGAEDFQWRWSKTAEERLLAAGEGRSSGSSGSAGVEASAWPGFRGAGRDGIVRGVKIRTDWAASPPVEMWRK